MMSEGKEEEEKEEEKEEEEEEKKERKKKKRRREEENGDGETAAQRLKRLREMIKIGRTKKVIFQKNERLYFFKEVALIL